MGLQGTLYFIGFLIGSLTWMRLTDYWGRKWMIFGGIVLHLLVLLTFVVDVDVYTIYAVLFCLGLKASLTVSISFILLLQIVGPKYRGIVPVFLGSFDSLSTLCLPFFFEYGKNWRILFWSNFGLAALLLLPQLLLIKESPKFLASMKRFGPAREVFNYISKFNGKQMFQNPLQGENTFQTSSNEKREHGIAALCKNRSLRKPLLLIPILWFTVAINSYGILFSLGNLSGSIYINGALSGAAEILGAIASGLMANTFGRKATLIVGFFVGGVGCLIYEPIKQEGVVVSYICILICKFCGSCNFNVVCLITPQLFPTLYRGRVFGFGSICARVGGALAPLIDGVCKNEFMYIFGGLSVVCSFCSCLLKETKGEVMADSGDQNNNLKLHFNSSEVIRQSYYSDHQASIKPIKNF